MTLPSETGLRETGRVRIPFDHVLLIIQSPITYTGDQTYWLKCGARNWTNGSAR